MPPDPDFLVLHTMRCIGFANADRIAAASGIAPELTSVRLAALAGRALVSSAPGPFDGWALTDEGRAAAELLVRHELEATGARDDVRRGYESFLTLNPQLLEVSTDWQMVRVADTHELNHHGDPGYDAAVLDRLVKIDRGAQRICADLGVPLTRYANYGSRLSAALDRSLAGEVAMVTEDLESYHNVWFQMHEDLLLTLGISRDQERES